MSWTTQLLCLGLVAAMVGGAGATHSWVVVAPHDSPRVAPRGGRVERQVANSASGAHMTSLTIDSEISYRYARTTIVSSITNTNRGYSRPIAFGVILPKAAFVSGFHIDIGRYRHFGEVKTKEEANRIYKDAGTNSRHTAAKVERAANLDTNLFNVELNVQPLESVTFNLTYDELLVRRLGGYTHEVYIVPDEVIENLKVTVKIQESHKLKDLSAVPLRLQDANSTSATDNNPAPRATVRQPTPASAVIEWSPTPDQQDDLNADGVEARFVVKYDVDRDSNPNQILVHDGYFVHFYAPNDLTPMDKHVVFVLDTSGSMKGTRIQQLKEAMAKILSDLRPDDFLSVAQFHDNVMAWKSSGGSVQLGLNDNVSADLVNKATPDMIQKAKNFVLGLSAVGGTNIHDSLILALKVVDAGADKFASMPKQPEPMIIFLTDGDANAGAVTVKAEISKAIAKANTKLTPIYSLGFANGIDMDFLRDLSMKNNGFARKIYEGSDAAVQLEDFYREISSPLLKDLKFSYTKVDPTTLTRNIFNTMNNGTEMVVAGKMPPGNPNRMHASLNATSQSGPYNASFAPPQSVAAPRPDFMERYWAYLNIQQLLEDANNEANKRKALEMALKYSFVTPVSSLVVEESSVLTDSTPLVPGSTGGGGSTGVGGSTGGGGSGGGASPRLEGLMPPTVYNLPEMEVALEETGIGESRVEAEEEPYLASEEEPEPVTEPEPLPLSWDSSVYNGTHVTIAKGRKTRTYLIKDNPTDKKFSLCRGTTIGVWHRCQHLNSCIATLLNTNFKTFQTSYFCAIPGNFAGVCCPSNP